MNAAAFRARNWLGCRARLTARDGSVGIATRRTAGVHFPAGARLFSSPQRSRPALGSSGCRGSFSRCVELQGREADHPPPGSAEVKNGGAILHFHMHLHGVMFN
jgi:hypothetical protein